MSLLVDERTGIVRRLTRRSVPPQFPRSYAIVDSYLADTTRFCPYAADTAGAGYAFADEARAVAAALGEAVERYCGNLVPPGLRTASYNELNTDAVDPRTIALFSTAQHAEPGFPCVPLARELALQWADGVDLATGRPVAVPASLVWVSHRDGPRTNPIIQAGLAAGPSRDAAYWNALCEIVERDAMTMTWTGRGRLRLVRPSDDIARLARGPAGALTTRFYAFPTEVGLPVVGALVRDAATGYLALGMGAHPDPDAALRKALGEAYQLLILLADYDDPHGAFARAATHPTSPLKPWRADRAYAQSYRADLRDAIDYGCHLQLHLDPTVQERFEAELAASVVGEVEPAAIATDAPTGLDDLVARLTRTGHRVVGVDVTTPDVAAGGLYAVRALVPGYYSNSAAGLPFLGGTRLPDRLAATPEGLARLLPLPH